MGFLEQQLLDLEKRIKRLRDADAEAQLLIDKLQEHIERHKSMVKDALVCLTEAGEITKDFDFCTAIRNAQKMLSSLRILNDYSQMDGTKELMG